MRFGIVFLCCLCSVLTFGINLPEEIMKIWGEKNITVSPNGEIIIYDLGDSCFKIFSKDLKKLNKPKISIGPGPSQIKKTFDYSIAASENQLFILEFLGNKEVKVFSKSGQYIKAIKTTIYPDRILVKDGCLYVFGSLMNSKEGQEIEEINIKNNESKVFTIKYKGKYLHSLSECIHNGKLYTIPEETKNMLFKVGEKGFVEAKWELPYSSAVVVEKTSNGFAKSTPEYYGEILINKSTLYGTFGFRDPKKDIIVKTVIFGYDLNKKTMIWDKECIDKDYILVKQENKNLILFDNEDYILLRMNIDNKIISILK